MRAFKKPAGRIPESGFDSGRMTPEKRRKLEELRLAREQREAQNKSGGRSNHGNPGKTRKKIRSRNAGHEEGLTDEREAFDNGRFGGEEAFISKKDRVCRTIIEWGVIALLVFSPLPAGSVNAWSVLVIQLTVLVMFGAYVLMREKPQVHPMLAPSLKWPCFFFTAFFVLVVVQLIPLPAFLVKAVSPNAHSLRLFYVPGFTGSEFAGLSLIPGHTLRMALELAAYLILGFLVVKTVTGYRQIMRIFSVLVGMAVFQSIYGLFELCRSNPRILFYKKEYYLDCVTGTFVNRNHLSGYLEMIVPLAIALVLARADFFDLSGVSWKQKLVRIFGKGIYVRLLLPAGIVVMSLAIVFSKSRSGIFLLVLSFLLILELSVLYFKGSEERKKTVSRFLKVLFLTVTFFALYIGIDSVLQRFSADRFLQEHRPLFWAQTWDIVEDFPVAGSGLGTFGAVYPAYDKLMVPAQFSHAHNDYLEYLSEMGAFGFVFLFGGIFVMLIKSFIVWKRRSNTRVKALALGGPVAVVLILLHSLTDFNLHIPANMLLFSVLLSLTAVLVLYKKNEGDEPGLDDDVLEDLSSGFTPQDWRYKRGITEWRKFLNRRKKSGSWAVVSGVLTVFLVASVVIIYWNHHLTGKAKKATDRMERIEICEEAKKIYPLNDMTYYEQGKAHLFLGLQDQSYPEVRHTQLESAVQEFETALACNPFSALAHFYLGRALRNLSYLEPETRMPGEKRGRRRLEDTAGEDLDVRYAAEYKKAAKLAGPYHQIYFETGKFFLSRWETVSDEDKAFVLDFMKEIYKNADKDQLLELMRFWEMNVKDYSVMDAILSERLSAYRLYAQFLGERSLSIRERRRYLAKLERIQFDQAREEFKAGENALLYSRIVQASAHFDECYKLLKRIHFYQELTGKELIAPEEYADLKKEVVLELAKCRIYEGRDFAGVEPLLRAYLEREERLAAVKNLESFLQRRDMIGKSMTAETDNLDRLAFQVFLNFKQNRFSEIIQLGRTLEKSFIVVPDSQKSAYAGVLIFVARAFQKRDYIYDAIAYYQRVLELDPDNLEVLLSLRRIYERLNSEAEVSRVTEKIKEFLTPREVLSEDRELERGEVFSRRLILDASPITLEIRFGGTNGGRKPLLSVRFNDVVIWDDYCDGKALSLVLNPKAGENRIFFHAVNTDIVIRSISYE